MLFTVPLVAGGDKLIMKTKAHKRVASSRFNLPGSKSDSKP
jgi:hypothetical protein